MQCQSGRIRGLEKDLFQNCGTIGVRPCLKTVIVIKNTTFDLEK